MRKEENMRKMLSPKKLNKALALVLVTALFVTGGFVDFGNNEVKATTSVADRVGNPRVSNNVSTWDCVYFGKYYQTSKKNGEYYREPIKWRVLEKANGQLFLMADQSLESIQYNESTKYFPGTEIIDNTWENSDLRTWLNDDFYNDAFTSDEKADIEASYVTADPKIGDSSHSVNQGNDTTDNVYVLSQLEASLTGYGFVDDTGASTTRASVNEDYAHRRHYNKSHTAEINNGVDGEGNDKGYILSHTYQCYDDCGIWWFRTVYDNTGHMTRSDYDGNISKPKPHYERNGCVRPVIHVNQNSDLLKYAGVISSDGSEIGACGENAMVQFDKSAYTLTIYGSGAMDDFNDYEAPWHKYYENIQTVIVDGNVTSISANAFEDCANIDYMYVSPNVTSISEDAFNGCMSPTFLISVQENSAAMTRCQQLEWNYTIIRSKEPLAIAIGEIRNTVHTETSVSFSFTNPMPGQSYEVSLDNEVIQEITDDIHDSDPEIYVRVDNLTAGSHIVKVNALVVGSKGLERRTRGKVIRINDEGYGDPVWEDRAEERVRWDCVYFGRYPQSKDENGDVEVDGVKYKTEKIKWRIIHVDEENEQFLLMADKSLDNRQFNTSNDPTWSKCSLRKWLNGLTDDPENCFISKAFNASEQSALISRPVKGTGVSDKVFTLDMSEMVIDDYGFSAEFTGEHNYSRTRRSNATDYYGRNNKSSEKWPVYVDIATWSDSGKPPYDPSDEYHKRATIYWLCGKKSNNNAQRINYPGNTDEGKGPSGTNACVRPFILVDAKSKDIEDAGAIDSYGNEYEPSTYYTVTVDGEQVARVKEGETYTLPENLAKNRAVGSSNLGYIDNENTKRAYRGGTTFSINKDRSFTSIKSLTTKVDGSVLKVNPNKDHALAFQCTMKLNNGTPMQGAAFEYGALLTTYDDYYNTYHEDLDVNTKEQTGHKIYKVKFGTGSGEYPFINETSFRVGIGNMRQENYARDFVVKPYVIIRYQGEGVADEEIYPTNPITVKSASSLAQTMMAKSNYKTRYSAAERQFIESYTVRETE